MMNDDERSWTLYYSFGMDGIVAEQGIFLLENYEGIKNCATGYEREPAGGNQIRLELGFSF